VNYLLDTNVISELVSKRPDAQVVAWVQSVEEHRLYLSVVTVGEIKKGIEKLPESNRKVELEAWLANGLLARFKDRLVDIDVDVMLEWGRLTARMDAAGKKMSVMDALIAASALYGEFKLATRNVSDFVGAGVELFDPWEVN
jgi:predicted nucleic acid-binding protein